MKVGWVWIQAAITAFGGFLGWFLGGMDSFLYALIVFVIVDFVTGIISAWHDRNLSSEIGGKGITRKIMIFAIVGVAHMIDSQVIGHDMVLRTAVIFFYLTNEGISILENAASIGLPVPSHLKEVLAGLHGKKEKEKELELNKDWAHEQESGDLTGGEDEYLIVEDESSNESDN